MAEMERSGLVADAFQLAAARQYKKNKPDAEKLRAFGVMLGDLQYPALTTEWGEAVLVRMTEILQEAINLTK